MPKILIIDDNRTILRALSHLLEMLGHRVATARGVAEGVELASGLDIDIVLSDIELGEESGLDIPRMLRPLGDWPMIAMSGHEDMGPACLAAGFSAFLPKPVTAAVLDQTIRELLDPARSHFGHAQATPR